MACQEAQLLLRGNASKPPCTEAKRKWSEYCCGETATDAAMVRAAATATASQPAPPGPDQQPSTSNRVQGQSSVRSTTEDTEAEEYGEEAPPAYQVPTVGSTAESGFTRLDRLATFSR
eukprot:s682_g15.t2